MAQLTQRGASLSEFLIIALPLILMTLLALEGFHWWHTKNMLHHALLQAGRTGSTDYAHPEHIRLAFEQGLKPWLNNEQRRQLEWASLSNQAQTPVVRISITNPNDDMFLDFSGHYRYPPTSQTYPGIDNDYQAEKYQQDLNRWAQGLGPRSQKNRFQANILEITLKYLHKPLIPGLNQLLKASAHWSDTEDQTAIKRSGVLVIQEQLSIPMQTHALKFDIPVNQHGISVSYGPASTPSISTPPPSACLGWWCGSNPSPSPPPSITPPPLELPPGLQPPNQELCGVSLCCVAS